MRLNKEKITLAATNCIYKKLIKIYYMNLLRVFSYIRKLNKT